MRVALGLLFLAAGVTWAQELPCGSTPVYNHCDFLFELNADEIKAHPTPYATAKLHIEFQSPRHRTQMVPAFWNGGGQLMVRFTPMDEGEWSYKITSNLRRFDHQEGKFTATASEAKGFVITANGHHWRYTEGNAAHLLMAADAQELAFMDDAGARGLADARAAEKFNHLRLYVVGDLRQPTFRVEKGPDVAFYKRLDDRIAYLNSKGITADLILARPGDFLSKTFPMASDREQYLQYMISRYSAFDITWLLADSFETIPNGRGILQQMGRYLSENDPYKHPRSAHALTTSAPLMADGWMNYIMYQNADVSLGAIEHQIYGVPQVNSFGGGNTAAYNADEFRHNLWRSFMNGEYLALSGAGAKSPETPAAKSLQVWYDLIAGTRHWELEPYFELDGGRAMALPDTEYIVYVEKPSGPIEVRVEKHEYDLKWIDPATGETQPIKSYKFDKFTGEPPSRDHDWVLHISREGQKRGMLNSWKFESRPFLMQEPEGSAAKIPYEIAQPSAEELSLSKPPKYAVALRRETRGTRSMLYLWTGDVPVDAEGYRVLGTGPQGTWTFDRSVFKTMPAVMNVRLYGMNANGKVYVLDKIFRVGP